MAYASQTDLVPAYLTQRDLIDLTADGDADVVNDSLVALRLQEASSFIDSYCGQRYQTPLQQSEDVKALACDITVYLLFARRRNARMDETVRTRYEDAVSFLKAISTGQASLDQPFSATPQASSGEILISPRPQQFDEHNIWGWDDDGRGRYGRY